MDRHIPDAKLHENTSLWHIGDKVADVKVIGIDSLCSVEASTQTYYGNSKPHFSLLDLR